MSSRLVKGAEPFWLETREGTRVHSCHESPSDVSFLTAVGWRVAPAVGAERHKPPIVKLTSLIFLFVAAAFAQQPKLQNAKFETISAGAGLRQTIEPLIQKQPGPLWIGYSIPVMRKERTMCCFDSYDEFRASGRCCNGCRLEKEGGNFISGNINSDCGPLEPPSSAFVMLRAEAQKITKVRTFTPDCPLDAAGLPVYWLEQVNPAQSIDFLTQTTESAINEAIDRKKDM